MIARLNFIFLLILAISTGCKSQEQKSTTPENDVYFIIAYGGGFTGLYEQFKIMNSGEILEYHEESDIYVKIMTLDKETVHAIFEELDALNIKHLDIDEPGNMSYIIEIPLNDDVHRITWGDDNYSVDKNLQVFFNRVLSEIDGKPKRGVNSK